MKRVYRDRLLKLARFLRQLPRRKFDYQIISQADDPDATCGTVGCAIGWMPAVFPRMVRYECVSNHFDGTIFAVKNPHSGLYDIEAAMEIFDIRLDEAEYLFVPSQGGNPLPDTATPKQVAKHIEKFVEEKTGQAKGRGVKA